MLPSVDADMRSILMTSSASRPLKQKPKMARWVDLKRLANNKQYLYASLAYFGHNWYVRRNALSCIQTPLHHPFAHSVPPPSFFPSCLLFSLFFIFREIYAFWSWARQFASGVETVLPSSNSTVNGSDSVVGTYDGAWRIMHNEDRDRGAALVAFLIVAVGFFGCFAGGFIADRWGRIYVCVGSLTVSGISSLIIGDIASPAWTVVVGVLWGITVGSDSAQYSTIVTEVVDPELLGTAMTAQFGFGYLSTFPSIYLVPAVVAKHGWGWGWRLLSPGSALGIFALVRLYNLQVVEGKRYIKSV